MKKLRNKKKKGFTLIELVIVLAVLAIIALIAIPNFNKVRTDSQEKADLRTCEVIERVTGMAIANQDMIVESTVAITIAPGNDNLVQDGEISNPAAANVFSWNPTNGRSNYVAALKEVKSPQQKNRTTYKVDITIDAATKEETVKVTVVNPSPAS